jgi:hypothetical protein
MRFLSLAALAAVSLCVLSAGSTTLNAQTTSHATKPVLGYQDPETGTFKPLEKAVPEAATAPLTGTIELTIAITLKTPLPTGGKVACSSVVAATSINLATSQVISYDETATVLATVSGATASCTVNIPYSWGIPPAASTIQTSLTGAYSVDMAGTVATGSITPALSRSSSSEFLSSKTIPATGTISKFTVNVTL